MPFDTAIIYTFSFIFPFSFCHMRLFFFFFFHDIADFDALKIMPRVQRAAKDALSRRAQDAARALTLDAQRCAKICYYAGDKIRDFYFIIFFVSFFALFRLFPRPFFSGCLFDFFFFFSSSFFFAFFLLLLLLQPLLFFTSLA